MVAPARVRRSAVARTAAAVSGVARSTSSDASARRGGRGAGAAGARRGEPRPPGPVPGPRAVKGGRGAARGGHARHVEDVLDAHRHAVQRPPEPPRARLRLALARDRARPRFVHAHPRADLRVARRDAREARLEQVERGERAVRDERGRAAGGERGEIVRSHPSRSCGARARPVKTTLTPQNVRRKGGPTNRVVRCPPTEERGNSLGAPVGKRVILRRIPPGTGLAPWTTYGSGRSGARWTG